MEYVILLVIVFFTISLVYSSAGFGGGSSYLAILTLISIPFTDIRMIALMCNIVVVCSSSYIFNKHKLLNISKSLPLVILSIPMAFIGGSLNIEETIFYVILGITLLLASLLMIFPIKYIPKISPGLIGNSVLGSSIGFLSGLVGIGGGIFLAPVLHLSQWDKSKAIVATSAFFILMNSIAGLSGQIYQNGFSLQFKFFLPLLISVLIGSMIGSRVSIKLLSANRIKSITALIIFIVALRLLINYL